MLTDVSPTRMELLKQKKKLVIARRGHKLLKDKLDELVRIMIILVKDVAKLRESADTELIKSRSYLHFAGAAAFPESAVEAVSVCESEIEMEISFRPLLNLRIPEFFINEKPPPPVYGSSQTTCALDESFEIFARALELLVSLAAKEKEVRMVADEIEKTRRRVNALEYILIPDITETIKFITMKIEETERNTLVRLMRIKDVVRAPMSHSAAYPGAPNMPLPE